MVFEMDKQFSTSSELDEWLVKEAKKYEIKKRNALYDSRMNCLEEQITNIKKDDFIKESSHQLIKAYCFSTPKDNIKFSEELNKKYFQKNYQEFVSIVNANKNMFSFYKLDECISILLDETKKAIEEKYIDEGAEFTIEQSEKLKRKHLEVLIVHSKELIEQVYANHSNNQNEFFRNEKDIALKYYHSLLNIKNYGFVADRVFN